MGGVFDPEIIESEIEELEKEANSDGFWNDIKRSNEVQQKISNLKKEVEDYRSLESKINDSIELLSLGDEDIVDEISKELDDISKLLDNLEIKVLLSGEYDELNCYLEIHPGAGGTESCDWASMLLRMYMMFCEKNGYKYRIIDEQKGDEAGIKSVTMYIEGNYPYGYFKGERGVHRLVRISPFDSGARRHTSFASVSVTPEYNKDVSVEIKESDLRIDVYHSSGAGGQSVNTSNSAVRITHIPSKIVVTCQNERSQLQNKEQAMHILKNKLYQLEMDKKEEEINKLKGINTNIDFGSQVRNYVLEPYKLIKDLRSNYETTNVDKVLDGDILPIMESLLKNNN